MRRETIAVHAGRRPDPATGAVTPPISLSTTFARAEDGELPGGFEYVRASNPNRDALETCLAELENGVAAVAFASGMAATTAILETLPAGRRRVIVPDDMYFGNRGLLGRTDLATVRVTEVDMHDLDAVRHACAERPALVWVETPSNPLLKITDVAAVARIAHAAGALCAVDNTWATPMLQRPVELGADLVMHSVTKYIGGHSDLMAGAVIAREPGPLLDALRANQQYKGAVPSPFDCWLALRGVATLPVRMQAHGASALAVAEFLAGHPAVTAVHYPGLASHPGHAIAARQMSSYGGMLSVEVGATRADAMRAAGALRLFTRATSLGGTHSLVEHRASVEGPGTKAPETLLRMSIGLEHPLDLIDDLAASLDRLV